MKEQPKLSFFILLLLISFASVNAVLFTPALPAISEFFGVTSSIGAYTITGFLLGYALGQLLYGPIANRYGRKPALYAGITLQIFSSLLCLLSGPLHSFTLLVVGRFLLAWGSGVGLKITFTLVNESYPPAQASQKIGYLMLAFAITPGLATFMGGILNSHFGWMSCFVAGIIYGLILLLLVTRLPETKRKLDYDAFDYQHLVTGYSQQFKNSQLVVGGVIMGCCTSFVYLFAAVAPYVAIDLYSLTSAQYGAANMLPPVGMVIGSFLSSYFVGNGVSLRKTIGYGLLVSLLGIVLLFMGVMTNQQVLIALFLPMILVYLGLCLILANASTIALYGTDDKAHGSAVMNFLNIGMATVMVVLLGYLTISKWLLLLGYLIIWTMMAGLFMIRPKIEPVMNQ